MRPFNKLRPLAISLSRCKSLLGIAAALGFATQVDLSAATVQFEGTTAPTPGDGISWLDPLNWEFDFVPFPSDDLVFGSGITGPIQLGGAQTANTLTFTGDFTVGAYGTRLTLTDTTGVVSVAAGELATINAAFTGSNGLMLSGGGALLLNNPAPAFTGSIVVDGVGTTLLHRQEGPTVQYNAVGGAQEFGRFDQVTLGVSTTVKNITLDNGGTYRLVGAGGNPEGNFKNIIIGAGGGTLDLAAGYLLQNLDDVGQITATANAFTKAGKGRLIITGAMADVNPLGGVVNITGGMISLDRLQGASTTAGTRWAGIATTATVNLTGGTLLANNGTAGTLDLPLINLNEGGILAFNGAVTHILGSNTGGTTLNVTGTGSLFFRDLFGPQNERLYRIRTDITGNGTLVAVPNTNAGGNPRMVIERNTSNEFTGVFRLPENMALEANPRNMPTVNTGKLLGQGDVDFAGWASRLDVRESTAGTGVFDYTANNLLLTSSQAGSVPRIAVLRGDTAAGTGHLFNFGSLTMTNQRLGIEGNNSYQVGISDTATIGGNAVIEMRTDGTLMVFSDTTAAISEDAAGRKLTLVKTGPGNAVARDVIVGGPISLSNLEVSTGTLQLRGTTGAIGLGFGNTAPTIVVNGGANSFTNGLPTQGLLHLDSNAGHIVGANVVVAAGQNTNRIADAAILEMRSNSILRLSSAADAGTTEVIGTTNVSGHATFDVAKFGAAPTPVALTLNAFNMTGTKATANFTGTSLGLSGNNTSRIVLNPGTTPTGNLGAEFHSGNEWTKYDSTPDSGFELGVTPFVVTDYTVDATGTDAGWAPGQQLKLNGGTTTVMTANRNVARINTQLTVANQAINVAGFTLTADQGGLLVSGLTTGIVDGATGAAPSGTGGVTSGTGTLYVHNNSQLDLRIPVTGAIDFVKSGTATLRLIHQNLNVGTGATGVNPFTTATWTSTLTGNWIINDGRLDVHRGQFLNGRPVILNGGHLEINEPVANAQADTIIPGWGNNIIVNGNATVAADDNGESADANTGDRAMVKLGSLTINNGSTMSHGSFSDMDIAYMGGATFNGTPTLNAVRGGVNSATIINGALTGSGFNMVAYNANSASVVLGGGPADTVANTYAGPVTVLAGSLRPNKANGTTAITDSAAAEDIIINGGALFWGPGQHGDLTTTNNINVTNNGLVGIAPTSPAAIKTAGMNQIADTANITLLTGTLGESDRITNEKFGSLVMKNGTLNVGLGTMEMDSATFSGGALGFDRGGTLKIGKATYLPGSFDQSVFTGLPVPGAFTTLEIGAGGISLTGQNITLGNGFSGNVAGSGGRLRLGGDLSFEGSDMIGGSYGRKGIFVQNGSSFRELGGSHIDLMGGTRNFNIDTDAIFTVTSPMINGGISKSGGGSLVLEPYLASTFNGPVIVNSGVLEAKGDGALGTSQGGVTIGNGGTVKLNSGWVFGDDFTVSGPGALVPGGLGLREVGALVAESGTIRLTGAVTISGGATLAGNTFIEPSVTPSTGGIPYRIGTLRIEAAGGISGTGTVTLSGHGDGVIVNGVKTTSGGVYKEGAGRWTVSGASTYVGSTTVAAGTLLINHASALGATAAGTVVLAGGSLAAEGGISVAEPLTLNGSGVDENGGALDSLSGNNTFSAPINLGSSATVRASNGRLDLTNSSSITGTDANLTLTGSGDGSVQGSINTGTGALIKNGIGTWTLRGANSFTGSTSVNGGVLTLDFATNNSPKIAPAADLNFGGGDLAVIGNGGAASVQFVAGTNLLAGGANISVTNGGAQAASLSLGPINRFVGTTVDFDLPTNGVITTTAAVVDGILGGYATVNDTNWATLSGSAVAPLTTYSPFATSGFTDNAIITRSTVAASSVTNSLKITGGAGVTGVNTGLNVVSGGLLYTGNRNAAIVGTGLVGGASEADEFFVHTASGVLEIATPIIGNLNGSLTKAGPGKLVLSGTSNFSGSVNINGGTLSIVGPGGTTHPTALGTSIGPRNLNINGGTFEVVGGDYDSGANNMYYVIGAAGATIRSSLGAIVTINDSTGPAPAQLSGPGDLTLTGGGRFNFSGGAPTFPNFTGRVTVDGGILSVGNSAVSGLMPLGSRADQTITLKPGTAMINLVNTGLGQNGLVNNIVVPNGGVEFFSGGGNRVYSGDIQLAGTNTIALFERDTINQERQLYFNGRVSGTGVTLNVFGSNFGNPFYLTSGSNNFSGTINLNANAVLETRMPGSLGLGDGDVTVNLQGVNSRLFLRHFQNGDYHANVNVNNTSEINSARMVNYAGGTSQLLSITNLTSSTDGILTIGGSDQYSTQVTGTATFTANTIINTTSGNLLLDNGLNFSGGANTLDKRGAGSLILHGPANHTGPTVLLGGFLIVQGGGTLGSTSAIEIRGGELRVENSTAVNPNRVNDAAPITLGGGALRLTGETTIGAISAVTGTTQIAFNPVSETEVSALTLPGFTRALGAVIQFQSDLTTTGATTSFSSRVSPRILIPGQANTTQTIPGLLGNNSLDFIQYDGTTIDGGQPLGVRDMRNPGTLNAPSNYSNDLAETAWNDSIILRRTNGADNTVVTTTLTADRALDAIKLETGGTNRDLTIDLSSFRLRIEGGGIVDVAATTHDTLITGSTGALTAGPAIAGTSPAELILGGTSTLMTIAATIDNNGTQPVAVVKTGPGTVNFNGNNTFTGGLFVTAGTANTTSPNGYGSTPSNIILSGGTLLFNIANAGTIGDLNVPDHAITVRANSLLVLDNGALAGTDNLVSLGPVTIDGPYTFGMRGFDGLDGTFTGTHTFTGTPTLDLAQTGGNTTGVNSVFTLNGPITGSGFNITSTGAVDTSTGLLQIGAGEATPNTYTGKVTVLIPNSFGEDLRVELNKAAGTTAITGDLEIQGGSVRNLAADQIADSSKLTISQGQFDANGKNETIASVTMTGGAFRTNSTAAVGTPAITVTGDFNAIGLDDTTGGGDGIGVNSNSTLFIGGVLRLNGYSRATLGASAATLIINGGLEMTGNTLQQSNGAGANITRLNGDVTTFASTNVARLGNSTDSDTFTELTGTRTFTVADGPAGLDLSLSSVVRDSPSPIATGGLIKTGPGTMQIEGGGTGNSYTGPTTINEGTVILFKTAGVTAIPGGPLTIGDGVGGARADRLILRNSNQIADANQVTISASGLLDLETFNASESIASLAGSGNVDLGANSTLTVNGSINTTYAGEIYGPGAFVKAGSGVLELKGTSDIAAGTTISGGALIVNGSVSGSAVTNAGAVLGGDGSIIGPVTIDTGGTVSPGNGPGSLDTGDLLLNGTMAAEVFSTSSYDSLNVTGSVTLAGPLSLTIGAGPFSGVFKLIVNDGTDPVIGTFAGLSEGSLVGTNGTTEFYITYVGNVDGGSIGNDVVLFIPEPGSLALLLGGIGFLAGRRRRRSN